VCVQALYCLHLLPWHPTLGGPTSSMRPASPTLPQSRLQLLAALQLSPSSSLWPLHANASQTCVTSSLSLPHPAPRPHTQPAQSALHLPRPTSPLPAALVQRPPHRLQVLRPLQTPLHSALVSRQVPAAVSHLQRHSAQCLTRMQLSQQLPHQWMLCCLT